MTTNRWDIKDLIKRHGDSTYRDYEGFHSPELVDRVQELTHSHTEHFITDDKLRPPIRDITANILAEWIENAIEHDNGTLDDTKWEEITQIVVYTVYEMLTTAHWTKSDVNWKEVNQ